MKRILGTFLALVVVSGCETNTAPDFEAPQLEQSILTVEGFDADKAAELSRNQATGPALASNLADPVPDEVIIEVNGIQWVWASPCALNSDPNFFCGPEGTVGKDGFRYATLAEWDLRPAREDFLDENGVLRCAAAWFDKAFDHCNYSDAALSTDQSFHDCCNLSTFGSAPAGVGGAAGQYGDPMHPVAETWLVRVLDPQTKDDCKKGGWEQYGFQNQGLCIQFVNTGKDSRG